MTQRFINCTHKESLILLKEDTLIPSRENEHVYYISEFDVEELYMVFEEFDCCLTYKLRIHFTLIKNRLVLNGRFIIRC